MVSRRHIRSSAIAALAFAALCPEGAGAMDWPASPQTLARVFATAQPGDRILLRSGHYGTFTGGPKASTVTIRPEPGATPSVRLALDGATNVRFEDLTITEAEVSARSRHVAIVGSRFTGMATLRDGPALDIVLDHNTHDDIDVCPDCLEGRVHITGGTGNRIPNGIVISNSHFAGGSADGVQNGGYGTQIGPGNEFEDLLQGDPDVAHTDPIQLYGSRRTHVVGNYLHDNEMAIMAADGPDHELIEDNVIVANHDERAVNLGSDDGSILRHNTLIGTVMHKSGTPGSPSQGTVIEDNVITGGVTRLDRSTAAREDYNLVGDGNLAGRHDIRGLPRFAAAVRPEGRQGYRLASDSPGRDAASDGTDMGAVLGTRSISEGLSSPSPGNDQVAPPTSIDGPTIALITPLLGIAIIKRSSVRVRAADGSGIRRVELRLAGRLVGRDRVAPYTWRADKRRLGSRWRTLTAWAFAHDGDTASVAVAVRRVRRGRPSRIRRASWSVRTSGAAGRTSVRASGAGHRALRVSLAHCRHPRARETSHLRVHVGRRRPAIPGTLCVRSVR